MNPRFVKLSGAKQAELKPDSLQKTAAFYASYYNDSISHRVFSVNAANMKEIVTNSDKELLLIVFYAAWCGPCRLNTPLVEKLQKEF